MTVPIMPIHKLRKRGYQPPTSSGSHVTNTMCLKDSSHAASPWMSKDSDGDEQGFRWGSGGPCSLSVERIQPLLGQFTLSHPVV